MSYADYDRWRRIPNQEPPVLSVVIPAYNEERRIVPTIGAIAAHVSAMGMPWELIVSDDGSSDGTAAAVRALGLANVVVLEPGFNTGKGGAVRRGVEAARGRYVLFSDADLSTPIEELDGMLQAIRADGYDVAIGSRSASGAGESSRSGIRRLLSFVLRFLVRHVVRLGVRDSQCGFKLFTHESARRLFAAQTIRGFSFDLELLYLAHKLDLRVAEIPVDWVDAPGSKVEGFREARRFLVDLFRIKTNDLRGRYAAA